MSKQRGIPGQLEGPVFQDLGCSCPILWGPGKDRMPSPTTPSFMCIPHGNQILNNTSAGHGMNNRIHIRGHHDMTDHSALIRPKKTQVAHARMFYGLTSVVLV